MKRKETPFEYAKGKAVTAVQIAAFNLITDAISKSIFKVTTNNSGGACVINETLPDFLITFLPKQLDDFISKQEPLFKDLGEATLAETKTSLRDALTPQPGKAFSRLNTDIKVFLEKARESKTLYTNQQTLLETLLNDERISNDLGIVIATTGLIPNTENIRGIALSNIGIPKEKLEREGTLTRRRNQMAEVLAPHFGINEEEARPICTEIITKLQAWPGKYAVLLGDFEDIFGSPEAESSFLIALKKNFPTITPETMHQVVEDCLITAATQLIPKADERLKQYQKTISCEQFVIEDAIRKQRNELISQIQKGTTPRLSDKKPIVDSPRNGTDAGKKDKNSAIAPHTPRDDNKNQINRSQSGHNLKSATTPRTPGTLSNGKDEKEVYPDNPSPGEKASSVDKRRNRLSQSLKNAFNIFKSPAAAPTPIPGSPPQREPSDTPSPSSSGSTDSNPLTHSNSSGKSKKELMESTKLPPGTAYVGNLMVRPLVRTPSPKQTNDVNTTPPETSVSASGSVSGATSPSGSATPSPRSSSPSASREGSEVDNPVTSPRASSAQTRYAKRNARDEILKRLGSDSSPSEKDSPPQR